MLRVRTKVRKKGCFPLYYPLREVSLSSCNFLFILLFFKVAHFPVVFILVAFFCYCYFYLVVFCPVVFCPMIFLPVASFLLAFNLVMFSFLFFSIGFLPSEFLYWLDFISVTFCHSVFYTSGISDSDFWPMAFCPSEFSSVALCPISTFSYILVVSFLKAFWEHSYHWYKIYFYSLASPSMITAFLQHCLWWLGD